MAGFKRYRVKNGLGENADANYVVEPGSGMESYLRSKWGDRLEEVPEEEYPAAEQQQAKMDAAQNYAAQQQQQQYSGPFADYYRQMRMQNAQMRREGEMLGNARANGGSLGGMIMRDTGGRATTGIGTRPSFAQETYVIDPVTGRRMLRR